MKKTMIALLASGTAMAVAAPAMAQDDPFTGPRAELLAGYSTTEAGSSIDNERNEDIDQSIEGVAYGVGVGYDFAVGDSIVLGIDAEITESTADTESAEAPVGFNLEYDAGRDIYVGGRIGVRAGDNALLYARGGYTNARLNLLASDGTEDGRAEIDLDGWRAGAGAEYALSNNMFVKAEYRYSNYQEAEFDFIGDDLVDPDTGESPRVSTDLDRHQVMLGVGFRF